MRLTRLRLVRLPLAMILVSTWGCRGVAAPLVPVQVASVVITPATATVNAGDLITLHATLFDATAAELPSPAYAIYWMPAAGWLEVVFTADGDAVLRAHGGFGTPSVAVEVSVEAGGVTSAPATIDIVEVAAPGGDQLVADPPGVSPPHAAIVTGQVAGTCQQNAVYSFATVQVLPSLTAPCPPDKRGEAAFFSTATRLDLREVTWTEPPPDDVVDFTGVPAPLVVPVAAWVAVSADVDAHKVTIREDLDRASSLMQTKRVGLTFALLGDTVGVVPAERIDEIGTGCADVFAADAAGTRPQDYVDGVPNVYYVETIDGLATGVRCGRRPQRLEDVVLIPVAGRSDMTLAHELGHVLGLVSPKQGHTKEVVSGFTDLNFMRDKLSLAEANARNHVSLGQGYRMNAEPESWVNRGPRAPDDPTPLRAGPTRACACNPYATSPCPKLPTDLGLPSEDIAGADAWPDWKCRDNVKLDGTDGGDDGFVVLDGMLWRERFACARDIVGEPGRHFGFTGLRAYFPNLFDVSLGDCPARATVFLKKHRMQRVDVDQEWDDREGEEKTVAVPQDDPIQVPVHVWVEDGAVDAASTMTFAKEVFLDQNPAGVTLEITQHSHDWDASTFTSLINRIANCEATVPWPAGQSTPDAVNVYVLAPRSPPLADAGIYCSLFKTDYLAVTTGGTSPVGTFAHQLGHALGLTHLDAASIAPENLMWAVDATSAGGGHLTLGQIYRLNVHVASWIQRAGTRADGVNCDDEDVAKDPALRCIGILVDPS
jgi:hypothetical protein